MKNIISVAKKILPAVLLGVFAMMLALSFICVREPASDALIASRVSSDGFFRAVSYGANELGEGAIASFLSTLIAVCPLFIRRAISFILCIVTLTLATSLVLPKETGTSSDGTDRETRCSVLIFTAALFCVTGKDILRDTLFCADGTVHYVLPALLLLVMLRLNERADTQRGALYAIPFTAFIISMFSYQAAVAALVIEAFFFIRVLRRHGRSMPHICSVGAALALLCACTVIFFISGADFPDGTSGAWIMSNFSVSVLRVSGFFIPILIFMLFTAVGTLCNDIIPAVRERTPVTVTFVLRVVLCLLTAATFAVMIPYSPLINATIIPGIMIIPRFLIAAALCTVLFVIDMHSGRDPLSARLALGAAAALLCTLVSFTYGGATYYIPMILILPVLARLFVGVRTRRAATVIAAGLGALYFAQVSVTPAHFIGVAALLIAGAILQASPLFRKHRIYETVVVLFIFVLFFMTNRWL